MSALITGSRTAEQRMFPGLTDFEISLNAPLRS